MSGTRSRSYISGIDPANSLSVATIGLLRSAGRGGDRLHDIVHHILADPKAHVAAHAGREPVVQAGPDARVRDLVDEPMQVAPAPGHAGHGPAGHGHLGDRAGITASLSGAGALAAQATSPAA